MTCPDIWGVWSLARTVEELLTETNLGLLRETLAWPLRNIETHPAKKEKFQF